MSFKDAATGSDSVDNTRIIDGMGSDWGDTFTINASHKPASVSVTTRECGSVLDIITTQIIMVMIISWFD